MDAFHDVVAVAHHPLRTLVHRGTVAFLALALACGIVVASLVGAPPAGRVLDAEDRDALRAAIEMGRSTPRENRTEAQAAVQRMSTS